jgi:hypothetical protein
MRIGDGIRFALTSMPFPVRILGMGAAPAAGDSKSSLSATSRKRRFGTRRSTAAEKPAPDSSATATRTTSPRWSNAWQAAIVRIARLTNPRWPPTARGSDENAAGERDSRAYSIFVRIIAAVKQVRKLSVRAFLDCLS